jgi:hypothetical protein
MAGTASRRPVVVGVLLLLVLVAVAGVKGSERADAGGLRATDNRAVVVIDDGVSRREACIVFRGTIDGIDALQLAGADTVLAGFGGMGAAVCSIDGVGCSSSACLTCQAPDHWIYLRGESGASSLTAAPLGASASKVGDGDIEAWIWGTTATPRPSPSIDDVCPARASTTTAAPPATTRPTTGSPTPTSAVTNVPTTRTSVIGGSPPLAAPVPGVSLPPPSPGSSTSVAPALPTPVETGPTTSVGFRADHDRTDAAAPTTTSRAEEAAPVHATDERPRPDDGGQAASPPPPGSATTSEAATPWPALLAVAALVAALSGWAVVLRRRDVASAR